MSDNESMFSARCPQLRDDKIVTLRLSPTTEEWADDLLRENWMKPEVERTDEALVVTVRVGGNTSGADVAANVLRDLQGSLDEGDVSAMEFDLTVRCEKPRGE